MRLWILAGALALAACGGGTSPRARPAGHVPVPTAAVPALVGAIRGQPAAPLFAQFGKPQLDLTEGRGRKLQFAGPICVLDAYLYPKSGREPVVTYVDARQPDGRDIDRASCVAALVAAKRR